MLNSRVFKTISVQLTALQSLIFALCFFALLIITYLTTTAALRAQMQNEIRGQLNAMFEDAKTDGVEAIARDIDELVGQSLGVTGYYYLSDSTGKKLAGNLNDVTPIDGWSENDKATGRASPTNANTDDDHQIWAEGLHLPDGSFLLVGQDAFRLLSVQKAIINAFAWSGGVALLLAALAGITLSRRFLRRIDDINLTSLAIMHGRLKERIPIRGTSDEIDRLSANLNQLFDNNQALLESLKQVSANIAHDLRTPLSRLRQRLEEARTKTHSKKIYEAAIDDAIIESDQLLSTFAALLRIAQIESGSRKTGFKAINLTDIFVRVADAYRAVAEDQGKKLEVHLDNEVSFFGDGDLLLQMSVNIVENAIRHTLPGTTIALKLQDTPTGTVATISDNGPGIPEDQIKKVFQHFYRLDTSRATPGNGLGLAMVAAVARLHDIAVALENNHPGLRVVLKFPKT